jgi:cytochrome c
MRFVAFVGVCVVGVLGCGGAAESNPPATPAAVQEPQTFAAQVSLGQKVYAQACASCHGASGEGTDAPRLVGLDKGALPLNPPPSAKFRKVQFKTAADVAGFAVKSMPPDRPGSLRESEYWAVLAFDLHANGVDLPTPLGPANAKDVVLHK